MAGLLVLVLMGLVPGRLLTTPAGLAILASLTALSALAFRMSLEMEDPADQALQRAQRAIWYEEDPRIVVMRLRGVGLRGRARLRRDIAVRCLERARGATGWTGSYGVLADPAVFAHVIEGELYQDDYERWVESPVPRGPRTWGALPTPVRPILSFLTIFN